MNLWRALAIALLIAVIASALLVVLMVRVEPQPIACMPDDETKEKVRQLMLDALDDGFKEHVGKVFAIWLTDDKDQPHRAAVGTRKGIRAYTGARKYVLTWNPPRCGATSP